jgi:hypothetical protein
MRSLEDVLADWRGDAAVLRKQGHDAQAARLETMATEAAEAAHPFVTWLSESEAMLQSGRRMPWLRSRYREWEREGHARKGPRGREYRMLIVPRRANVESAAEAGRKAAREQAA